MWAIFAIVFTGLYVTPYTVVTEERFDSKHECEVFVESVIYGKGLEVTKEGDVYTFTNEAGDVVSASCGKVNN